MRLRSWLVPVLICGACSGAEPAPSDVLGTGGSGGVALPATGGSGGGVATGAGSGGQPASTTATGGAGGASGGPVAGSGGGASIDPIADAGVDGGPGVTDACDRACLLDVMQTYLDALVAHDPVMAKFAAGAKYTVNGEIAKLGDGFWKTASALAVEERLDFADPQEGQVATMLVIEEGAGEVIYQVRLKVVAGEITEIEAMEVRDADAANGFFSPMNMKPQPVFTQAIDPAQRMTRAELKTVVDLYLRYLDGDIGGSDVPFDENCARYENGFRTANGVSSFEFQSWSFNVVDRYLVFDEEAGIAWGMFPFSEAAEPLVVGEAFKVIDGKIMMIQAVMAYMPAKAWD